jgi:hypothetical protein
MSVPYTTVTIPITRRQVRCPNAISKLIFQLNYKGVLTKDVVWGDPLEIKLESFDNFMKIVEIWRKSGRKEINQLYLFMVEKVEFKSKFVDPRRNRSDGNLLEISLIISPRDTDEFTELFKKAHIRNIRI